MGVKETDELYDSIVKDFTNNKHYYYVWKGRDRISNSWYKFLCDMDYEELAYVLNDQEVYLRRAKKDNWVYWSWRRVNNFWCKVDYIKGLYDKAVDKLYSDFKFLSM